MNLYDSLLSKAISEICTRFHQSSESQKEQIIIELDAIAKKLTPVQTHRPQEDVLADIKKAMQGDRARVFFAHCYVSWYRSSQSVNAKPQLHHWSQLDMNNRRLFLEMLALRDLGHWDDEELFQFEQHCLSVIEKRA